MKNTILTAAALGSAIALGAGLAQAASGSVSGTDRKFVTEAASGGMLEVEAGRLAQSQGQDPQIKQFGQRMVTDHTKANQQLQSIASSKGIEVPSSLDAKHQAMYDRLKKLKGADFDQAYGKMMASDHKQDVADFRKAASSAQDPDVKSFASQTLPTLEEHERMAQSLPGAGGAATHHASADDSDRSR
jgi:putative membrane protein